MSWAANNSFVGDWKFNPSKSKLADVMKVDSVGGNKYAFDFGDGISESIIADGTDQPGRDGTTFSVAVEGPDAWKVVRKKAGKPMISAAWKLSRDGNSLTDDFTGFAPNGSSTTVHYLYQRKAEGAGFAGTWVSTSVTVPAFVMKIQPPEGDGDGVSFNSLTDGERRSVKFDGKDYPHIGPNANPNAVSSVRQVNERTLEMTDKSKGKITDTQKFELSSDLKTLTLTIDAPGRSEPNVFVFERQ